LPQPCLAGGSTAGWSLLVIEDRLDRVRAAGGTRACRGRVWRKLFADRDVARTGSSVASSSSRP
jgi:hypothetical protein